MLGTIGLRGLRIACVIGVDDAEREAVQPIEVAVEAALDLATAADTDGLQHTVDYRLLADRLDALAQEGGYELLEAFASDAAMLLLDSWPSIETVRLEVRKSGAVDAAKYSFCRLERRRG